MMREIQRSFKASGFASSEEKQHMRVIHNSQHLHQESNSFLKTVKWAHMIEVPFNFTAIRSLAIKTIKGDMFMLIFMFIILSY